MIMSICSEKQVRQPLLKYFHNTVYAFILRGYSYLWWGLGLLSDGLIILLNIENNEHDIAIILCGRNNRLITIL